MVVDWLLVIELLPFIEPLLVVEPAVEAPVVEPPPLPVDADIEPVDVLAADDPTFTLPQPTNIPRARKTRITPRVRIFGGTYHG